MRAGKGVIQATGDEFKFPCNRESVYENADNVASHENEIYEATLDEVLEESEQYGNGESNVSIKK